MNVTASLESLGLTLGLSSDGNLIMDGLKQLDYEQRARAVSLAKEHKPAIVEDIRKRLSLDATHTSTTPEQVAYAKRLMVDCPESPKGWWVHVWYCARCKTANQCTAWRHLRGEVELMRESGKPYSLHLAESLNAEGEVVQ